MANRFPLVVDTTDNNKIKELPVGDNLNLAGSGIVNAVSIQTDGTLTANNVIVNGQQLSAVALSGQYADLEGAPTGFSGSYNDLINKPTIPTNIRSLTDVLGDEPNNGDILVWNAIAGRYEPSQIDISFDLGNYTLGDIGNVVVVGDTTNKWLKYYSGAWRPSNILYSDIQSTPTIPTALSQLTNDVGFVTSETNSQILSFEGTQLTISNGNTVDLTALLDNTDAQTLSLVGTNLTISNGNTVDLTALLDNTDAQTLSLVGTNLTISNGNTVDLASIVGDTVGNFTLAASTIDTDDSSAITFIPAVAMASDLTVENDLTVNGDIITTSTGTPAFESATTINLITDNLNTSQTWTFGTDGSLTLPAGATITSNEFVLDIQALGVDKVLALTASGNVDITGLTVGITGTSGLNIYGGGGDLNIGNDYFQIANAGLAGSMIEDYGSFSILTDRLNNLAGPFVFGTDNTLTFPDSSIQTGAAISIADLKTLVAASTDFADFQARIAAL